jgi:hypothetical protein
LSAVYFHKYNNQRVHTVQDSGGMFSLKEDTDVVAQDVQTFMMRHTLLVNTLLR